MNRIIHERRNTRHCVTEKTWPIKPGTYVISTSENHFFNGNHPQYKMMSLLWHQGVPVTVQEGQVSDVVVTQLSTDELIMLALTSVR